MRNRNFYLLTSIRFPSLVTCRQKKKKSDLGDMHPLLLKDKLELIRVNQLTISATPGKHHHALLPVHSSRNMAQHLRNTVKGKAALAVLSCKMSSRLQQKCWVNLRNVSHEGLLFIISLPARTSLTFCCQRWSFSSVCVLSRHYKESCSVKILWQTDNRWHIRWESTTKTNYQDMHQIHVIVHLFTLKTASRTFIFCQGKTGRATYWFYCKEIQSRKLTV